MLLLQLRHYALRLEPMRSEVREKENGQVVYDTQHLRMLRWRKCIAM